MRPPQGLPRRPETYSKSPGRAPLRRRALPRGSRSADHHVAINFVAVRQVAAGKNGSGASSQCHEAAIKGSDEFVAAFGGHRERHQAEARLASHRSDVAQAAGEGIVADDRWGLVGEEVNAFDRLVGSEQQLFIGTRAIDGAVVAYAKGDAVRDPFTGQSQAAQLFDDIQLTHEIRGRTAVPHQRSYPWRRGRRWVRLRG